MSRNNLFELNELSQSQNDLIPEREQKTQEKTGRAVRPKPRPRTVLTRTRHSNDSLEGDGVQNEAFALDEYTISSAGDHDHDFKSNAAAKSSKNDYVDTFPSRLVSSTNPAKANDPLVVFASGDAGADVNANASSTWTTTKFSEKFKVERETKINERGSQRRPKPKPRTKSKEDLLGDDQRDRETGGKSEISARTRPRKSGNDDSEFSEGTSGQSVLESQKLKGGESDEYLVIPVPEAEDNEKDNQLSNYKQSDASAGTGFLGKWKKAIKTFSKEAVSISSRQSSIKRKPRSDDVDVESGAGIEEQSQANQQREESMELTPTQAASARVRTPEKGRKKQSRTKTDAHKISGRSSGSSQTPSPSPRAPAHSKSSESDASPSPQHSTHSKLSKRRVQQGERESSEFLGITIHRSDSLPADPFCTHPVVKVTLMNQDGSYISKRRERISSGRGLRQGGIGRGVETSDSEDEGGRNKRGGRRTRGILSRSKSSASSASTNLSNDAILPMLTQPYQFSSYGHGHSHKHSLSSVSVPVREPAWNELILFDEPFSKFVHEDSTCIFFFEIMDFLPVDHIEKVSGRNRYSGSEMGWHKVAWAFLKPVGANGVRNVNHKLRLQLYKPERLTQREADAGPEVYCWWKFRRLSKLDATTLHVTVKGIAPPSCPTASLQALLAMRKEELTEALIDSQLQTEVKVGADEGSGDDDDDGDGSLKLKHGRSGTAKELVIVPVQEPPEWNRLKGQSCKPPNKLLKALPSSDLDSLKISVSGNVHCVRFSPCGQFLAAGFDTGQMHTVLIFEIPSAVLVKSLRCHHGLIYDLAWRKHFSRDDHVTNYLATASADSTASIWRCRQDRNRSVNVSLVKILLHPSFVYCIRFHSKDPNLVATGCFDRMIRIWSIDSKKGSMDGQETDSSPVIMLDNPASFVNCLEFHPSGKYLFAGDGEGSMHQWKCSSNSQRWSLDRCIKLHEHSNRPINSITIHPTYGNKLLVHSRDSCLKIVDVETFLVLQTFHGFKNERFNIGSTFSPCGNLVLCGSEDSTLCVWDADTSRILQFIKPADADVENAVITCVDYHPHDFYVAIGVLSANSSSVPCPILLYTYEQPPKLQVSTIVKLKNIARTHQKSGGGNMKVSSVSVNENTNSVRDQLKQEILSNQSRSSTPSTNPRSASFAAGGAPQESVDSTDKFMSILSKLDTALKVTNTMLHANAKSEEKPKSQSQSQLESSSPNKIREQKQRLQRPSTGNSQRSTKSTNARERKSPTAAPARTKDQTLSPDRQRYRKEPPPEDDDDDDSFRHNLHEGSGDSQNQQQQQRPRIRTQAEAAASIRVEASQSQTNTENSDYSNSSPPTKDKIKISSSGSSKRERRREKMHVID